MGKRDGYREELRAGLKMRKSDPDWRKKLEEVLVGGRVPEGADFRDFMARPRIQIGMNLNNAIARAAEKRNMSRLGYMRRAIAAFCAHDLDEDFAVLLENSPRIQDFNRRVTGVDRPEDGIPKGDDAQGFGPWRITGLEE